MENQTDKGLEFAIEPGSAGIEIEKRTTAVSCRIHGWFLKGSCFSLHPTP